MKNQLINQSKALLLSAALVGASVTTLSVTAAESNNTATEQQQVQKDKKQNKRGKHHKKQFKKMAKALNLDDVQKAQIKAIFADAKEQKKAQKVAMKAVKDELKAITDADVLDEQAVLSVYASHSDTFAQKMLARIKVKHAISQILTPEQRVKWEKMQDRKGKKGKRSRR